ncbi:YfhD family protein [Paenibacillus shunpengii]|uniref:YfhD family protein n=1 Tax=Paenibacillus shunpengii TaxID=2054424 RepID=A0ABW5SR00_9BACL|nr:MULTISPECIES: YfhD family protein [unclassified Paenibacillus]OMC69031.1 YfhD family protein [Paenibacillus sp. FSL H7-0326]SDX07016.1 YfhD-like protein [Paenibacillus sp. PDC88]
MSSNRRKDRVLKKSEKISELASAKNEDVEFSSAEADQEDIEALRRSEAADQRQMKKLDDYRYE